MRKPMDDPSNTTGTLDQADEEALTYTEELEAAAGTEVAFWTIGRSPLMVSARRHQEEAATDPRMDQSRIRYSTPLASEMEQSHG
jgi:hypothetical protein